jgi:hypothetical protein
LPEKISFALHISPDIHVKPGIIPETGDGKSISTCNNNLNTEINFIMNGGDSIMDALEADKQKTQIHGNLYKTILQKENSLPIYHCDRQP